MVNGEQVLELIRRVLEAPDLELTFESRSEDFSEWDSLGQLKICLALEEEFDVKIPMHKMAELDGVSEILRFVNAA